MTSFCFEAGKGEQGVCNKSFGAVEQGRWVPTMTEEGLFEGLPCHCLGSLDILHHAGCSCQTAVCEQRLPFRPRQRRVLWLLSMSMQSKMRSLHPWECHLRACRQQSDLRFQTFICQTSVKLLVTYADFNVSFCSFLLSTIGSDSPPCWSEDPAVSLGQQPLWLRDFYLAFGQSWQTLPRSGSQPALLCF